MLGRKQGSRRQALPPLRSVPSRMHSFVPARAERDELLAIAARLSRLSISRKDPHAFFEERSELVFELRRIAQGGAYCSPLSGPASWEREASC
jgi:hypothetical protein